MLFRSANGNQTPFLSVPSPLLLLSPAPLSYNVLILVTCYELSGDLKVMDFQTKLPAQSTSLFILLWAVLTGPTQSITTSNVVEVIGLGVGEGLVPHLQIHLIHRLEVGLNAAEYGKSDLGVMS